MVENTFTIAVFGFSRIERTHVSCVCKLSKALSHRSVKYHPVNFQMVDFMQAQYADILLVDADNAPALQAWSFFKAKWPSVPAILVTKESVDTDDLIEVSLARRRMPGLLFRLLETIAEHLKAKDVYNKRSSGTYGNNVMITSATSENRSRPTVQ